MPTGIASVLPAPPPDHARTTHALKNREIPVMLAKFSIRAKITTVVAVLLVAMTGMGLLAVRNMRAINASTVDITTSWLPSVRVLGDLRAGLITYRNVVREHMLAETAQDKEAAEKILATVIESNLKIRKSYEQLITSAEERAIFNEWARLSDSYDAGVREVVALSRNSVGKAPHEAHELNSKTVNKIGIEADAVLKKDIELNNAGADRAGREGRGQLRLGLRDACGHTRQRHHSRGCRQLLPGSRCLARDYLHCHADAGIGQRRPDRRGAASG
jgi:hypothetical protein